MKVITILYSIIPIILCLLNCIIDFVFTAVPCFLMLSSPLFIEPNAQIDSSTEMLKRTLKFTLQEHL